MGIAKIVARIVKIIILLAIPSLFWPLMMEGFKNIPYNMLDFRPLIITFAVDIAMILYIVLFVKYKFEKLIILPTSFLLTLIPVFICNSFYLSYYHINTFLFILTYTLPFTSITVVINSLKKGSKNKETGKNDGQ